MNNENKRKWRPGIFKITGDGVSLENEGVRPAHDQFVRLSEFHTLEQRIEELEGAINSHFMKTGIASVKADRELWKIVESKGA